MKHLEIFFLAILCGAIIVMGHMIGYNNATLGQSILGVIVLVAVGYSGYLIAHLPGLNKLPSIVWITATAIFVSSAAFPFNQFVVDSTSKIPFLAVATPVLAYAGLAVGKDIEAFKKISWRIIPVALAVIAGTFLFATIIAQWALQVEGAI